MMKFPIGARVRFKSLEALKAQWPGFEVPAEKSSSQDGFPPDEILNTLWFVAWSKDAPHVFEVREHIRVQNLSGPRPAWIYRLDSHFAELVPHEALELVALPPIERGTTSMDALAGIYAAVFGGVISAEDVDVNCARACARDAVADWIKLEAELRDEQCLAGDSPRKEE